MNHKQNNFRTPPSTLQPEQAKTSIIPMSVLIAQQSKSKSQSCLTYVTKGIKPKSQTSLAYEYHENGLFFEKQYTIENICPHVLKKSPENDKIYKPVDPHDPAIQELARDIKKNGVLEPLVVSSDGYIISGHRRREAAILADLEIVPCRIENVDHDDPDFLKILVSFNTQRVKNHGEQLREELIQVNPNETYRELIKYRDEQVQIEAETIVVKERKGRKKITQAKSEMVKATIAVINENRKFWPLSDRQIHYRLLNNPPLRNIKKPNSVYKNNLKCYQDLCDLLTRLRLSGEISMNAIADPTRPTSNWDVYNNPKDFMQRELDSLFKGYRRNLQQSQPSHIEVVAEKMTVESIIRPICGKYNIPYTIGRGYSSLPSRYEIKRRFERSGKDKLLLLILSDFDPEGINIGESLLQSIRDDFHIRNAEAVRVGLNQEHIQRFNLNSNTAEAKQSSARYKGFVEKYGKKVYELEALTPQELQTILSETIDGVIDTKLFNAELELEKKDSAYFQVARKIICENTLLFLEEYE